MYVCLNIATTTDPAGQDSRQRRKGVKGLLLVSQEEVPHGIGLRTGDGGDTADGAGDCQRPAQLSMDYWEEPGLLFLFPEALTGLFGKAGKEGLCVFVDIF